MATTFYASETKPADHATKPFRIVLHDKFGDLSTHLHTTDDNGFHNGNYFGENTPENMERALADYRARCARHELKTNE
jgi:hypothetical protein